MTEKDGWYGKYVVRKANGETVDPKAVYFTLRLDTDRFARTAVRAYIEACREERPELAKDLEKIIEFCERSSG